jgi:hypothetical protein
VKYNELGAKSALEVDNMPVKEGVRNHEDGANSDEASTDASKDVNEYQESNKYGGVYEVTGCGESHRDEELENIGCVGYRRIHVVSKWLCLRSDVTNETKRLMDDRKVSKGKRLERKVKKRTPVNRVSEHWRP